MFYWLSLKGILSVKAETVTADFGTTDFNCSDYSGHNIYCTINVTGTVQTEANGNWIANNAYEVNWTITITYLNQSIYNNNDFSIEFYNPQNPIYSNLIQNVVVSDTTVTPQKSGTLSMTFKPESAITGFKLDSAFALKVYDKENIVTSGSWLQSYNNPPIPINIVSSQQANPTPTVPELATLVLGIALAVVTGSLIIYKAKSSRN